MADHGDPMASAPEVNPVENVYGASEGFPQPEPAQPVDHVVRLGSHDTTNASPSPYPVTAEKRKVGRPRARNPDGSFKFPKRAPSVKRSPPPDGMKRPVGRPRKRAADGTPLYPDRPRKDAPAADGEPRPPRVPRSDWLGDPFTRKEIFRALVEYEYSWLPTVQALKQKFPGKFDKLGESTVRSWFEPGTNHLRPPVLKKLGKVSKMNVKDDPDIPSEMIPDSPEGVIQTQPKRMATASFSFKGGRELFKFST